MGNKYIHYGSSKFDINKFNKIENRSWFTKPDGGFWASNINSEYSWKDWCLDQEFMLDELKQNFKFDLSKDSKILKIEDHSQLNDLPEIKIDKIFNKLLRKTWKLLDFEELSKNYDAIEVLISKDRQLYWDLYGWDCDSILIMNPEIIKEE